jgi:hypothetical protein
MLSPEPFSSGNARSLSTSRRLDPKTYFCSGVGRCRFGSYTSWCFHIDSTVGALLRARVSLAIVGLIPDFSIRW